MGNRPRNHFDGSMSPKRSLELKRELCQSDVAIDSQRQKSRNSASDVSPVSRCPSIARVDDTDVNRLIGATASPTIIDRANRAQRFDRATS
jgi:hypothetical protein